MEMGTALVRQLKVGFNPDGYIRKRTIVGFKSYLAWRSRQGDPVFFEDLCVSMQQWSHRSKVYVPSRKEKFRRSTYWFFGYYPQSLNEEWRILFSKDLWEEIRRRKIKHHPDRQPGDGEIFRLLIHAERIMLRRRNDMQNYHKSDKPEWL